MPLLVEGEPLLEIPSDIETYIHSIPTLQERSRQLRDKEIRVVDHEGSLYVNQREFAATTPHDEHVQTLVTDDATTCHIVVLRHSGSGATCLAHCDGCDTAGGILNILKAVKVLSSDVPGRLELHLAGGFKDSRQESVQLSKELLGVLIELEEEVHLITATILGINDAVRGGVHYPVIYGLAVDVPSGDIFPASCSHKEPDLAIRSACHFADCNNMVNIYTSGTGVVSIGPYNWDPQPDIADWINVPDPFIRRYLSTSPEQEPVHFEAQVRAALSILRDHPQPALTLFPNGQPRRYRRDPTGHWQRMDST